MAKPWQPLPFPAAWKGLLVTGQNLAEGSDELGYAAMAHNIHLSGGAVSARLGSRVVNGLVALVDSGWGTGGNGTVVTTSVPNGTAPFTTGQNVTVTHVNGTTETSVVTSASPANPQSSLVINPAFANAPQLGARLEQSFSVGSCMGIVEVPGQVNGFADAWHYLTVDTFAVQPQFSVVAPRSLRYSSAVLVSNFVNLWFPASYVTAASSSTSFTLGNIDGLLVGSKLTSSVDSYQVTYTVLTITASTRVVTITPAMSGTPAVGTIINFIQALPVSGHLALPLTSITMTNMAQYAGSVHIAFRCFIPGGDMTSDLVYPPLRYEPSSFRVYRHGLATPTWSPVTAITTTSGSLVAGTYTYAVVERNSVTKAESPKMSLGSFQITPGPNALRIPLPIPSDPQVDQVRVYRGASGSVTALRLVPLSSVTYPSTTCNSGWSTTTGTIVSAAGFYTGGAMANMYLQVRYGTGLVVTAPITSISGTTITLATALPSAPSVGSVVRQIPAATSDPSWTAPANGAYVADDQASDASISNNRGVRDFLDSQNNVVGPYALDTRIPETATIIVHWPQANRLVAVTDRGKSLVFSDIADLDESALKGESWPSVNQVPINYDDGEPITAVVPFYDALLVFKLSSIWRVRGGQGTGRLDLVIEPVSFAYDHGGIGTFQQHNVVVDQNELIFPAEDGFYRINRYENTAESGFQSERLSQDIDDLWDQITRRQRDTLHGVFVRNPRQARFFFYPGPWQSMGDAGINGYLNGLTFQFPTGSDGKGAGWTTRGRLATIDQVQGVSPTTDWITCSTIGRFVVNPGATLEHNFSGQDTSVDTYVTAIVGTANGWVLAQDLNYTDEGRYVIVPNYQGVWFRPAGAGIPARGRAIDIVHGGLGSTAYGVLILLVDLYASLSSTPTSSSSLAVHGAANTTGSSRIIFQSRGEWHRIGFSGFTTSSFAPMVSRLVIKGWTYWFQPLAVQARTVTVKGATPVYTDAG